MVSLPSAHPILSLHLTDPTLTPLLSSSSSTNPQSSRQQYRALTDLTTASVTAYNSSTRLGLGLPQRILIETSKTGPVILHSYLDPQPSRPRTELDITGSGTASGTAGAVLNRTREALRPLSSSTEEEIIAGEDAHDDDAAADASNNEEITANSQLSVNGMDKRNESEDVEASGEQTMKDEEVQLAPMLIATVVAPSHDHDARRAAGRLERLGAEFQKRWVKVQAAEKEAANEETTAEG